MFTPQVRDRVQGVGQCYPALRPQIPISRQRWAEDCLQRLKLLLMLSDRAANSDTTDVLRGSGNHPQLSEWRKPWELASAAYFNRQHRVLWWRILHGCVMCGAFSAYIGRATPQQACCPFASCSTPTKPQTISHMFLELPQSSTGFAAFGKPCRATRLTPQSPPS